MALVRRAGPSTRCSMLARGERPQRPARDACCCATCWSTTPSAPTSRASWCCASRRATASPTTSSTASTAATARDAARPIDPIDGYQLATALDDIVDFAEQAADNARRSTASRRRWSRPSQLGDVLVGAGEQVAARPARAAHRRRPRALPRRDPPPGERGRPHQPRRRRVAVRQRHRPDGRDPLEGHLRVARGEPSTRASTSPTCSRASACGAGPRSGGN